ncbi:MAG TPA: hypothetical protein P5531_05760 [Bacteroidales bacterium]|nr:hypothetical protein [Bacteroidales bacterium]HSA42913.1 hypothetical protein [Bacteroidales bacterium]
MKVHKKIKLIYTLILPAWLIPAVCPAQQQPYSEEVTVIAAFKPVIPDANKISFNPRIEDTILPKPQFRYTIASTPYPTTYKPEPIEAAKMAGEPIRKLHENLLKLGFGTYMTPYADYFFNSTRSRSLAYGVNAKHLSSSGKISGYGFPGYSENKLSFFAKKFSEKKHNLFADGGLARKVVHYYGYHPEDYNPAPDKDDIRQRFILANLNTGISSASPDSSRLAYSARLNTALLTDKYKSRETHVALNGGIERSDQLLKFSKTQRWGIQTAIDYFNDKAENRHASGRAVIAIKPFLSAKRNALQLRAGFNTSIEADSTAHLHLYPDIEARANLLPERLTLYFGLNGKLERNSYRMFTEENPFVDPGIPLSFKNTRINVYGGFNANLFDLFDLFFELSRSQVENQYFYVNDFSDSLNNKFTLLYDDNCDVFKLTSELAWHYSDRFRMAYRIHMHQYFTSDVLPWHISDYNMSLTLAYNIRDKLLFDAALLYYDRMYAIQYGPGGAIESKYLRDRLDLNLGIEYRYSELIGAFIRLNNLANIQYYYWNEYPAQKMNAMAGLSFSF